MNISFIDSGTFAMEGPTSGLLITICEMLSVLEQGGNQVEIASFVKDDLETFPEELLKTLKTPVHINSYGKNSSSSNAFAAHFSKNTPDVIIINMAAVFVTPEDINLLELALQTASTVITVCADTLFPAVDNNDEQLLCQYKKLVTQTKIVSTSKDIRSFLQNEHSITSSLLPTLISRERITVAKHEPKYITLINHHPVKGRAVFDALIKALPNRDYMVVQTWPDVPAYTPPTSRVVFKQFAPDIRDIYSESKMLVVPSLCDEGPSRVVVEGLFNGIPVLAHRIGSIPEVGGHVANYVEPPLIKGYETKGSVLHPIVDEAEIDAVGKAFADLVVSIEANDSQEKSELRSNFANSIISQANKCFVSFMEALKVSGDESRVQ